MEKVSKFLVSKTIPNYLFVILGLISFILFIVVIAVASSGSNSNDTEKPKDTVPKTDSTDHEGDITDQQKESDSTDHEGDITDQQKESDSTDQKEDSSDVPVLSSWEKYKKAEKYLYIWEVYLSIGCIETFWDTYYSKGKFPASDEIGSLEYEVFIKELNNINVEVELVTFLGKDPNDFYEINRVDTVAKMVKDLSQKVQIKALHFDQEPDDNFESLLKMYIRVNEIFPASAILRPYWLNLKMSSLESQFTDKDFYNSFSDCETLVDALMKVTKYTDLMAYNQNYNIVSGYMEKLKTIAERHPDNEAKNVIEISGEDGVPEDDTLHYRYLEDKDTFFNFVYNMSNKYNGITFHYYEVWYKTLYCVWPSTNKPYDGGEPKDC